ncbi:hypothetical protein, partial [Alienimonas sp. DA493]|uniref:hypothetical protein n=1 Tax=Alienimonas sp. DA493 TaxID=3373605 RepID=UPI0037541418
TPASVDPEAVLGRVGLVVAALGEHGGPVVYNASLSRTSEAPPASKIKFEDALQLIGREHAGRLVRKRTRDTPPGTISLAEFKEAVALATAAAPTVEGGGRGRGV